jgi:hypothetical protein
MSKKAQAKRFITELHRIAEQTLNSVFTKDKLVEICTRMNLQVSHSDAYDLLKRSCL